MDRVGAAPAGKVEVGSLHSTPELRDRVTAALRGLYPHLTEGKSDKQAFAAVERQWVTDALVQWEANAALPSMTEVLEKAREDATKASRAAEAKARKDADSIDAAPDA